MFFYDIGRQYVNKNVFAHFCAFFAHFWPFRGHFSFFSSTRGKNFGAEGAKGLAKMVSFGAIFTKMCTCEAFLLIFGHFGVSKYILTCAEGAEESWSFFPG